MDNRILQNIPGWLALYMQLQSRAAFAPVVSRNKKLTIGKRQKSLKERANRRKASKKH